VTWRFNKSKQWQGLFSGWHYSVLLGITENFHNNELFAVNKILFDKIPTNIPQQNGMRKPKINLHQFIS